MFFFIQLKNKIIISLVETNDPNYCDGVQIDADQAAEIKGAEGAVFRFENNKIYKLTVAEIEKNDYQSLFPFYKIFEPPTEHELIQAELLLNQTRIVINQDQQDTVLAELLLNQIGGI